MASLRFILYVLEFIVYVKVTVARKYDRYCDYARL
jgi:hypothetical protein